MAGVGKFSSLILLMWTSGVFLYLNILSQKRRMTAGPTLDPRLINIGRTQCVKPVNAFESTLFHLTHFVLPHSPQVQR